MVGLYDEFYINVLCFYLPPPPSGTPPSRRRRASDTFVLTHPRPSGWKYNDECVRAEYVLRKEGSRLGEVSQFQTDNEWFVVKDRDEGACGRLYNVSRDVACRVSLFVVYFSPWQSYLFLDLSCFLSFTIFVYLSVAYVASWEGDAARHVSTKIPHQVREEQSGGNTTHVKDWKTGCECKLM